MTPHTQIEMLADLAATFPALKTAPLEDWAGADWARSGGIRVACDDNVLIPDGVPMLTNSPGMQDQDEIDGVMHSAFWNWLGRRGWYYENYDGVTLFLLPASLIPEFESVPAPAGWAPFTTGECPF